MSVEVREVRAQSSLLSPQASREKFLVVQTSFLGDVVLTTPVLTEIRRRHPNSWLAVLCTPQARSLLEGNPDVDEIIADDKKGFDRGWKGLWHKAADLRSRGFTIALALHKSFRTALLLFLARIPFRIGFRQSAGWFLYHRRVEREATLHDVERNLSILKPLGITSAECLKAVRVEAGPGTRESVESTFRSLGIFQNELTFGLNPGSVWPTKRWSVESYADLMIRLKRRYSCRILLFGGPEDGDIARSVQTLSGDLGVNLVGKIALRELSSALDKCSVFITNDSGPMHVAVARGVPVVAIFCATTPSLGFYPYTSKAVVVEKELACRPCSSHGGRRCPLGTEDCIRLIKTEDVLLAVERILEHEKEPSRATTDSHRPEFLVL